MKRILLTIIFALSMQVIFAQTKAKIEYCSVELRTTISGKPSYELYYTKPNGEVEITKLDPNTKDSSPVVIFLNKLGAEGWVISTSNLISVGVSSFYSIILKREI